MRVLGPTLQGDLAGMGKMHRRGLGDGFEVRADQADERKGIQAGRAGVQIVRGHGLLRYEELSIIPYGMRGGLALAHPRMALGRHSGLECMVRNLGFTLKTG